MNHISADGIHFVFPVHRLGLQTDSDPRFKMILKMAAHFFWRAVLVLHTFTIAKVPHTAGFGAESLTLKGAD